ncbi:MAG: T9SS type B sorting domain-containing protein [Chlorobi bacterium]|nr:T9SS type B sorting domain-containing protein [Chlorobiota bacterium]
MLRIPPSAGFPYDSIIISPNQYLQCDTCQTTQVFLPDTSIIFVIYVENQWNCTWKDSITYNVSYPSFRYLVYPEPPLCYNETVNLKIYPTGNWLPYTYSLTSSDSIIVACSTCEQTTITGLDTGRVIITVTDALGCSLSDTAHIPVLPELKVSVSDTEVCFGTSQVTLFPNIVNDLTELDYLWIVPNADVDCATCDSLIIYPEETTPVLILIRDTFGCEASDTALLKVLPAPQFALNDTVICWHDTPTTTIQINHYIPYSIVWYANPDLIDCDTCQRISIYPVDYLSITATLTDTMGCSWQDSMLVFVDKGPELEILGDTVFLQGTPIQLELSTDAQRFFWLINNRPVAVDQYVFSLPSGLIQDSTYVMAYGYNDLGCRAYDTVLVRIVEVQCDKALFVPNAFTPNEDGLNDQFHIYTLNPFINIKHWEVRNQWGEILFQTSNVTFDNKGHSIQAWDGTFNGNKVPPDVYVYYITYECDGKQFMKKGDVSVLY